MNRWAQGRLNRSESPEVLRRPGRLVTKTEDSTLRLQNLGQRQFSANIPDDLY